MNEALNAAKEAAALGEVPVGAVLVHDGEIIARAHNEVETRQDPTAHAEILAIQRACGALGSWRLAGTELFVTLEPCPMCIGAILLARIKAVYFGSYDPRMGAAGSLFDLSNHPGLGSGVKVYPELLAEECGALLSNFFARQRSV